MMIEGRYWVKIINKTRRAYFSYGTTDKLKKEFQDELYQRI